MTEEPEPGTAPFLQPRIVLPFLLVAMTYINAMEERVNFVLRE